LQAVSKILRKTPIPRNNLTELVKRRRMAQKRNEPFGSRHRVGQPELLGKDPP
jgi:hypothetical protein